MKPKRTEASATPSVTRHIPRILASPAMGPADWGLFIWAPSGAAATFQRRMELRNSWSLIIPTSFFPLIT